MNAKELLELSKTDLWQASVQARITAINSDSELWALTTEFEGFASNMKPLLLDKECASALKIAWREVCFRDKRRNK